MKDPDLLVYVTNDDIAMARRALERARDAGAPAERIALLRRDLEQLWAQQARQIVTEFRSTQDHRSA